MPLDASITPEQARAELERRRAPQFGPGPNGSVADMATGDVVARFPNTSPDGAEPRVQPATPLPAPVNMVRAALQPSTSLGLAGGLIGGAYGGPAGARYGGVVGSGIGTSLDKIIAGEPVFSLENAGDTAANMAFSLGGDILGQKVASFVGSKVGALKGRIASKVWGEATDGAEAVHEAGKQLALDAQNDVANVLAAGGVPMRPEDLDRAVQGIFSASDLMESQALDQAQAVASGSFIGSGPIRNLKVIQERTLEAAKNAYKRAVGPYFDDAGKLGKALSAKVEKFAEGQKAIESGLHERVRAIAGNTTVDLTGIHGNLDSTLALIDKIAGANPDIEGISKIVQSAREIAGRAAGGVAADGTPIPPTPFTFDEAKKLRTMYRELAEKVGKAGYNSAAKDAKQVVKNLSDVMEKSLDDTVPVDPAGRTVRQLWQRANRKSFEINDIVEKAQIKSLIELADEGGVGSQVVEELAPKLGTAASIRRVRFLLGGKDTYEWKALSRWKLEGMLNGMTPKKALSLLTDVQSSGPGPAAYREMFGEAYPKIVKLLKVASFAKNANPAGSKMAPHLIETGLVLSLPAAVMKGPLAALGAAGTAGTYVVGMKTLAKWLTDPKTADMALGLIRPGRTGPPSLLISQAARYIAQDIAEGGTGTIPDIKPLPTSATRDQLRQMNQEKQQPSAYNGIRG